MRKIITIIAVLFCLFAGFAEGTSKIQRVLYEDPKGDYKVVLQMDPSNVGLPIKYPEEGLKAAIMTMKASALAAGWDGWSKGWAIMFPKEPSRNSKVYKYPERNKIVAAENGMFINLLFQFITPQDIEEAQKVLDAGCACVEIIIFDTAHSYESIIGILQMYITDFWIGAWAYDPMDHLDELLKNAPKQIK